MVILILLVGKLKNKYECGWGIKKPLYSCIRDENVWWYSVLRLNIHFTMTTLLCYSISQPASNKPNCLYLELLKALITLQMFYSFHSIKSITFKLDEISKRNTGIPQ